MVIYVVSMPIQVKVVHFCLGVSTSGLVVYFFLGFGDFGGWIGYETNNL
jgi:hypothetical protein